MIEFSNVDGQVHFKCRVIGYQSPESLIDDWCLLRVTIKHGDHTFDHVDPAIDTFGLVRLHEWFTCLLEKRLPKYACLSFTEPCISFEFLACLDDGIRISLNLSHELKPSFELNQLGFNKKDWRIVFVLNNEALSKILEGINQTLELYPVRGKKQS